MFAVDRMGVEGRIWSMKWESRLAWPIAGMFLILAAVVSIVVIRQDEPENTGAESELVHTRDERGVRDGPGCTAPSVRPKTKRPEMEHSEVSRRLLKLREDDDKPAIHEDLAQLADARRLTEVEHVLRAWCRSGDLELAQWALEFSGNSDPGLHLVLCAEALSHRSEVIRDSASAELERETGTRFEGSSQAFSWLDQNRK